MKHLILFGFFWFLSSTSVIAHHSINAEYDRESPISLNGVITEVEWQSPHIWYYIDVSNEQGEVEKWAISGGSPNMLMRRGVYKSVLEIGMTITVQGFRARDGSNNAAGRQVTRSDGSNVFAR
ncbi:MAG: DUF6152 family protein [Gammaproteobacteria bacterium]|nr:DUF6152 family protein [Gammaproteobacteria bacterium]